jgi:hypothetical protein
MILIGGGLPNYGAGQIEPNFETTDNDPRSYTLQHGQSHAVL